MFFVQVNGVIAKYTIDLAEARRYKREAARAMNAGFMRRTELSLWETNGDEGYPYAHAKQLSRVN